MDDLSKALELDLPDISYKNHDLGSAKQQTAVLIRLPSIPGASVERFFAHWNQIDAAEKAYAMGLAYAEDRRRAIIMRAKARAAARIAQAIAEGRI